MNRVSIDKSLLLIIDLQSDFINKNTKDLPRKIEKELAKNKFDFYGFTMFINDINSLFFTKLNYKGCMDEKEKCLVVNNRNYPIFKKNIYSALNGELKTFIKENGITSIYLCGIDTDACVLKTALDLFENNYNVFVIESLCMSHSGRKNHDFAIKLLKKLIGNEYVIKEYNERI